MISRKEGRKERLDLPPHALCHVDNNNPSILKKREERKEGWKRREGMELANSGREYGWPIMGRERMLLVNGKGDERTVASFK